MKNLLLWNIRDLNLSEYLQQSTQASELPFEAISWKLSHFWHLLTISRVPTLLIRVPLKLAVAFLLGILGPTLSLSLSGCSPVLSSLTHIAFFLISTISQQTYRSFLWYLSLFKTKDALHVSFPGILKASCSTFQTCYFLRFTKYVQQFYPNSRPVSKLPASGKEVRSKPRNGH